MNYAFYDLQLGFLFRACGETVKRPQINYWQKLIVHVIAPSVCVCVCLCLPGGLCRTLILFFCRPLCPFRRFICGNSLQTLDFGALVPATANGFQLNSSQRLSNEWIRIFISCVIVVCSAGIHRGASGMAMQTERTTNVHFWFGNCTISFRKCDRTYHTYPNDDDERTLRL